MTTEDRVEIELNDSSYERDRTRPHLGRLYHFIKLVFTIIAGDMREVFRGFYPALGNNEFLDIHIQALRLPQIADEPIGSKRQRLLIASNSMMYLGTRKSLYNFMNTNFKKPWKMVEFPKDAFTTGNDYYATPIGTGKIMNGEGLYIYLSGLTDAERVTIDEYVDSNTPPDVGLTLLDLNLAPQTLLHKEEII